MLYQDKEQPYYHIQLIHFLPLDTIGLHRVGNPDEKPAVSLHLYWPPITVCKKFKEETGQAENCEVTYHSKDGVKVLSYN